MREGERPSARARLRRSLSPQGRHSEISGRHSRGGEPLARRVLRVRRARRTRSRPARACLDTVVAGIIVPGIVVPRAGHAMNDIKELAERIDALEARLTYQD